MRIRGVRPDIALVEIVCKDCIERGDVAGHSGHEGGHQRREADAQHSRWIELGHQGRERLVVVRAAGAFHRQGITGAALRERKRRNAGDDDCVRQAQGRKPPGNSQGNVLRFDILRETADSNIIEGKAVSAANTPEYLAGHCQVAKHDSVECDNGDQVTPSPSVS